MNRGKSTLTCRVNRAKKEELKVEILEKCALR